MASAGAERFTVDLSNELCNQGHEVTLCVLRDDSISGQGFNKKYIQKEVSYINLKIPAGLNLNNIYKLYKVVAQQKPDVVHCHQNLVNYIFPLTFIFPKLSFFHTIHNMAEREVKNNLEYWLKRYFYRTEKVKAITISPETDSSFNDYYKFKSFRKILNGRSTPEPTSLFPNVQNEINNYKKAGKTVFVHVGRFHPQKNHSMLVNVFNKLKAAGEETILYILGSGFETDDAKEIRKRAQKHIHFVGEKHNVTDYLLAADAFCLSSVYEGMPISLIEAMACGCTPVCTPAGGIPNMIDDGETGFLSRSTSEKDYYETVVRYLRSYNNINKNDLKKAFKQMYHISSCAKNYVLAYKLVSD